MNLFKQYRENVISTLNDLVAEDVLPAGLDFKNVTVEPPRDDSHGDIATNAAMVLAKQAKKKPRDIAEALQPKLQAGANVASVDVAGPGFINIRMTESFWTEQLSSVLAEAAAYGRSDMGADKTVNVEYVSANPTGPMHVGHCRGAIFGDALAELLKWAGYDVVREYYINDAGAQVDVLARSAFLRYREALGEDIGAIPEGLYPGDYLVPVGKALADAHGDKLKTMDEGDWLPMIRAFAIDAMMDMIRDDLAALNIRHDVFFSEKSLHDKNMVAELVASLEAEDKIYTGVLEPPKGKKPEDWEPRPQKLFRASNYGDDTDRPIQKSDGTWTYFASDIAYCRDKYERGAEDLIFVLGADHGGYVKRLSAVCQAVTDNKAAVDVKLVQLVNLMENGQPLKMSKRAGTFVTLRDVVDRVGSDVTRFIMLYRKNDASLEFDFAKVMEQSRDNPVFYVQYAHARTWSVKRQAVEAFDDSIVSEDVIAAADLALLTAQEELALIREMASFPRIVEAAAAAHEPHRVAFYLYDLAASFHALWTRGKEDKGLRIVQENDRELTTARLALAQGLAVVIANGLNIMGVTPQTSM